MEIGTTVQVTATALGGWDNPELNGRIADESVHRGDVGRIVCDAPWLEPGEWFIAQFTIKDGPAKGGDLFVPCVEHDHVVVVAIEPKAKRRPGTMKTKRKSDPGLTSLQSLLP